MVARVVLVLVILASASPGLCSNFETCKTCPTGWTMWGKNCYRFYNQPRLNFTASEDFCVSSIPLDRVCPCNTPHLASVESEDENKFLFDFWKSLRGPSQWKQFVRIGYTDSASEGTWQWIDGSSSNFTLWDGSQPDNKQERQHCAVMWKRPQGSSGDRGRWDDQACESCRTFFCKFRPLD